MADNSTIRTREEAAELYLARRRSLSPEQKVVLAPLEGKRFFRFGNSWRRLSGLVEAIVNDGEDKVVVETVNKSWEF